MTGPCRAATSPREVARTREALTTLLARLDPDAADRAAAPPPPARPTVVLVGAPGRGRRRAAGRAARSRTQVAVDGARHPRRPLGVPLLEELDLVVPARGPDPGSWPVDGATAALVLADAAAPLGAEELDALARAAGRVDTVVFALTRTEAHRGWRTVLEADRALVAEHVPRLAGAPWFPVSAELARRAGTATPEAAEALRRRSGIAALQRELHRLVARRRRMLAEANALRLLAAGLDGVAARADATRSALRAPADGAGDLARRRDELLAARAALRRDHHTRWRADLAAARVAAADDLAARVRALAAATRARIDDADRAGLAAIPRRPRRRGRDAGRRRRRGPRHAAARAGRGDPRRPRPGRRAAGAAGRGSGDRRRRRPASCRRPRTRPAEDRLLVVAGASGGLGLSRLALLPLLAVPIAPVALGAALVPVSVGLGLGAAGWVARARRLAADRAHLRQWTAEALAEVRGDLDRVLADALITTEREVTLALDAALEHRARDLDDALAAAERAVRARGRRPGRRRPGRRAHRRRGPRGARPRRDPAAPARRAAGPRGCSPNRHHGRRRRPSLAPWSSCPTTPRWTPGSTPRRTSIPVARPRSCSCAAPDGPHALGPGHGRQRRRRARRHRGGRRARTRSSWPPTSTATGASTSSPACSPTARRPPTTDARAAARALGRGPAPARADDRSGHRTVGPRRLILDPVAGGR